MMQPAEIVARPGLARCQRRRSSCDVVHDVLLRTLGRQVHASLARAIQPFHALVDGDVLYAVTTDEVDDDSMDSLTLGVIASELAWDAVLASFDAD